MIKKIIYNEIYKSVLVDKFLNSIHRCGKKYVIEKAFYLIVKGLKKKQLNFLLIFFFSLEMVKPTINAISAIKHGKTYFVGAVLNFQDQYFLAIKWIVKSIFENKGTSLVVKILSEFLNISFSFKSSALKKKKQTYFLIYKNRSLSHYRWK